MIKDLRIFKGLNIQNALFVDNEPFNLVHQLNSLVPIIDFTGEEAYTTETQDQQLLILANYLSGLAEKNCVNISQENSLYFKYSALAKEEGR